ncbi:MAG: hypothetical protein Kow0059_18690 [Candidatus Sumerlaeia bacterium]
MRVGKPQFGRPADEHLRALSGGMPHGAAFRKKSLVVPGFYRGASGFYKILRAEAFGEFGASGW